MFHFPGYASYIAVRSQIFRSVEFPHSDISGSKVAWHLPEAYRCHAASFIAFQSLGIHHTPLICFLSLVREKWKFKNRNNLLFDTIFVFTPAKCLSTSRDPEMKSLISFFGATHLHEVEKTQMGNCFGGGIQLSKFARTMLFNKKTAFSKRPVNHEGHRPALGVLTDSQHDALTSI